MQQPSIMSQSCHMALTTLRPEINLLRSEPWPPGLGHSDPESETPGLGHFHFRHVRFRWFENSGAHRIRSIRSIRASTTCEMLSMDFPRVSRVNEYPRFLLISFDLWVLASSHWKVTRPHMQMWKWWKMKGKTWSCDKDCWNRICPGKWMSWIEPDANTFQMSIGPFKTFWTSRLNKSLSPFAAKMLRCCRCCLMRLAVYNMTT